LLVKPTLLVVAGCNGSGKSTFSRILIDSSITPFDYDKRFLEVYESLQDFDLKDKMCHNKTWNILTESIDDSINKKIDFCYETNFNSTPMYWVDKFRECGYNIEMIFFCLDSIVEAKRRVQIRFESGGHFVPDNEVKERFNLGYSNLDANFTYFDRIDLYDSSGYNITPTHILSLSNGEIYSMSKYPEFLDQLLPHITSLVNDYLNSIQA
jgi:predicted ABC-type ATPase